jgi:hypothetical protein
LINEELIDLRHQPPFWNGELIEAAQALDDVCQAFEAVRNHRRSLIGRLAVNRRSGTAAANESPFRNARLTGLGRPASGPLGPGRRPK